MEQQSASGELLSTICWMASLDSAASDFAEATKSSDDCELLDMIVKRGALLICPLTASNVFLMFLSVAIPRETSLVSRQMVDLGPSPFGTYRLYR
jgi:hypothetical protein